MRVVETDELCKRGCAYCADSDRKQTRGRGLRIHCPYEFCIYNELDRMVDYERYCDRLDRTYGREFMRLLEVIAPKDCS